MEHQVDKLRVAQRERMTPRRRRGKRGSVPALASKTDLKVLDASGVMPR
jgi:hypothetical protein